MSETSAWVPLSDLPAYLTLGWRVKRPLEQRTGETERKLEWPYESEPVTPEPKPDSVTGIIRQAREARK